MKALLHHKITHGEINIYMRKWSAKSWHPLGLVGIASSLIYRGHHIWIRSLNCLVVRHVIREKKVEKIWRKGQDK